MIQLNYRDARPIYEQVKDGLRRLVVTGAIQERERLPSVRQLAASLAINPNTIQKAYEALEAEGYVYTVPGRGTFATAQTDVSRERRETLLAGGLHVSYGGTMLGYQQALCETGGGGLFALTVDGRQGCACVERWEDTAAVKELLLPPELEKRGLAALAEQMGAARWTVRVPDPAGTPFGMLRWYRQDIARRWDWLHAAGHLGLAFD